MIISKRFKRSVLFVIASSIFAINSPAQTVKPDFDATCTLTDLWQTNVPGQLMDAEPALSKDGKIFLVSIDTTKQDHYFLNLFDTNGKKVFLEGLSEWRVGNNPQEIDPDGTIYEANYGNLYALNPDGTTKWVFSSPDEAEAIIVAMVVTDKLVVFSSTTKVYAVNKQGKLVWTYDDAGTWIDKVAASNSTIYLLSVDRDKLYALNHKGEFKWIYSEFSAYAKFSWPAVNKKTDTVYITTYGDLLSLNSNGKLNWKTRLSSYQYNESNYGPTVDESDGTIYIDGTPMIPGSERNRYAYAFDANGQQKWRIPLPGTVDWHRLSRSPIVTNNGIVFIGENEKTDYPYKDEIYVLNKDGKFVCPSISLGLAKNAYYMSMDHQGHLNIALYPNSILAKSITVTANK